MSDKTNKLKILEIWIFLANEVHNINDSILHTSSLVVDTLLVLVVHFKAPPTP
jgi:hypothetical protein